MKKSNIIKISGCGIVLVLALMLGCDSYNEFNITEIPYVNKSSVLLYVGEGAGDRNRIQLEYSPYNRQYTWASDVPEVASVNQSGLITAHSEGYATITVASKDDFIMVSVQVREFVPITGFTLDRSSFSGLVNDIFIVSVTPEPANASEVNIQWTSSNESVAIVYSNGLVKILGAGESIITATGDNGVVKTVTVVCKLKFQITSANIPDYSASQPGTNGIGPPWVLIGLSSQSTGYPLMNLFDGNPGTFWHGSYGGGAISNFPHWFILDMKSTITITDLMMQKRQEAAGNNFRSCNGFYIYSCPDEEVDQSDPDNGYPWVFQGEFTFDHLTNSEQWYEIPNIEGRYFRIYFDTKHREPTAANNYIQLAEFAIYGF